MRINEIFYSLQGEGYMTGIPSVFVRFSGCNLACDFCDTDHNGFLEMSVDEIVARVNAYPSRNGVLTGGEPTLQADVRLLERLKEEGKHIQIETNGTIRPADEVVNLIDWITCSPKNERVKIQRIDEVKVLFKDPEQPMEYAERLVAAHNAKAMLQPCDVADADKNRAITSAAVEYVKSHPMWRLSLQAHKMLDIR